MCVCVCVNHPGIKGSRAKVKDKSRFIPDAQGADFYWGLSSELSGSQGKKGHRILDSHFTPVPGAPGVKGYSQSQGRGGSQSPGVSRVTGSENSPATALLQAFTRKFMYFMSNLRPRRQQEIST